MVEDSRDSIYSKETKVFEVTAELTVVKKYQVNADDEAEAQEIFSNTLLSDDTMEVEYAIIIGIKPID